MKLVIMEQQPPLSSLFLTGHLLVFPLHVIASFTARSNGETALILAARKGHAATVEILLANGADLHHGNIRMCHDSIAC